ncbi:hypothetical protein [Microbacterium karelineae]|uniref:hypothetical protein n=1 Tax=Microbacterium karelineae TaxID=2654283 RepID=UPI001E53102D|nr:hypothetical protein [Microbacterium karelineae]
MRTDDFSHAPPHSRCEAMVLAPADARPARRRDGRGRSFRIVDGSRRARMTLFAAVDDARAYAARTPGARLWTADPHGFANGSYAGRDGLDVIERFTPLSAERERGVDPPAVRRPPGVAERPTRAARRSQRRADDDRPGPLDAGALFFGETRYRSPLSWIAFSRRWVRLVARMSRMRGYRGHRVYWTAPFALGTIAFFADDDAMLAMARGAEHRELMVWLTATDRWATAGFIRFYRAEPEREDPPLAVREVTTGRELGAFVGQPLRAAERELAVPLLRPVIRSWFAGTSPHPELITLLTAHDASGRAVARTTVHTDPRFDEKIGARALLFGATDLGGDERAGRAAMAALLPELERRARAIGARELVGPVSLLPNQAGGVITSGFDERGFVDSAWNAEWVPRAYEEAGFARWNESDTWIVDVAGNGDPAPPSADELARAGITIEHASRRDVPRLIPEVREVLNAAFAQLPYYTPITPDEMAAATDGLAWLLDERLLLAARDRSGDLVAFVIAIPDITRAVQRSGGRMDPLTLARLLAGRRRIRDAVLVIQGTRPDAQGRGILTLLSRELQHGLRAGGYRTLRSTYVGRDNPASARQFERFGGRPLHGYTFYRRSIDG